VNIVIDMNLSPSWIAILAAGGHTAVHWSTVGDPRAPDREILGWAKRHEHLVFTHDLDFGAILAATQAAAPSVVQVRSQDVTPEALGDIVMRSLREHGDALASGALVTIHPDRARVRILPVGRE
jgi:predicted nuclease of predicted toxin-antitoxin system